MNSLSQDPAMRPRQSGFTDVATGVMLGGILTQWNPGADCWDWGMGWGWTGWNAAFCGTCAIEQAALANHVPSLVRKTTLGWGNPSPSYACVFISRFNHLPLPQAMGLAQTYLTLQTAVLLSFSLTMTTNSESSERQPMSDATLETLASNR